MKLAALITTWRCNINKVGDTLDNIYDLWKCDGVADETVSVHLLKSIIILKLN